FHFLMRPSGALNVSPREMASFLDLLLHRGSFGGVAIVPPDALDRMEIPATTAGARAGLKVGYGLQSTTEMGEGGLVWHGHNGGLDGARSELNYLPEAGVGYFLAINGEDDAFRELGKVIRGYLVKDLPKPELLPPADAGDAPSQYAGWYELVNVRNE